MPDFLQPMADGSFRGNPNEKINIELQKKRDRRDGESYYLDWDGSVTGPCPPINKPVQQDQNGGGKGGTRGGGVGKKIDIPHDNKIKADIQAGEPMDTSTVTANDGRNIATLNELAMINGYVTKWVMINETGPSHKKEFTWQLTLGQFTTTGTGPNKKVAKNEASEKMLTMLPKEWSQKVKERDSKKGKGAMKREASENGIKIEPNPKKKQVDNSIKIENRIKVVNDSKQKKDEEHIKIVIKADNPISCLFEYASKKKISVPVFNSVFGARSPTMEVKIEGQTYKASSNNLKAAKAACATIAWESIKTLL